MSFIAELKSMGETTYTATFKTPTNVYTDSRITSKTWATSGTLDCLLWFASMAKTTISEKYRDIVDAVLIADTVDVTFTIAEDGKVTVNSQDYEIIKVDDIALQSEVTQVLLRKYND
jgi:hypothetical protein